MLDRLRDYSRCLAEKRRWAIATIIESSGSVPRPVGTSMAIRDDMTTIGSVSGGCVEAALVEAARQCLEQDVSAVERFGYADDDAIAIGLMCGGEITVLVQPVAHVAAQLESIRDSAAAQAESEPQGESGPQSGTGRHSEAGQHCEAGESAPVGGLVRSVPPSTAPSSAARPSTVPPSAGSAPSAAGPGPAAVRGDGHAVRPDDERELRRQYGHAAEEILATVAAGRCALVDVRDEDDPACPVVGRVFVESVQRPARVLIYGASDYSAAIADAARMLGRHVTVCDARAVFATAERHPSADEVVVQVPAEHFRSEWEAGRIDARTAVLVMTHDTRFDIPLLEEALVLEESAVLKEGLVLEKRLGRGLGYIGALGSRTTNERRMRDLAERGLAEQAGRRLHAPVGLDIGARTPHEVAVSVLAEIIAEENGRAESLGPVGQLRFGDGPIHSDSRGHTDSPVHTDSRAHTDGPFGAA